MSEANGKTVEKPKEERKPGIQKIEFKVLKDTGNLLAFVSVKAIVEGFGIMLLGDMKVIRSKKGDLFIGMPSKKVGDKYYDVYFPLSKESRNNLQTTILAAWESHDKTVTAKPASDDEVPPEWA